mmetsp:Transcript_59001/g.93887  ORF Transcript_59001/g.93887 Transcript_59001/m.93887 type:complete len:92 (+) Transcript_59001:480-755(+)
MTAVPTVEANQILRPILTAVIRPPLIRVILIEIEREREREDRESTKKRSTRDHEAEADRGRDLDHREEKNTRNTKRNRQIMENLTSMQMVT